VGGKRGLQVERGVSLYEVVVHHVVHPLAVELGGEGRVHRLEANGEIEAEDLALFMGGLVAAACEANSEEHYKSKDVFERGAAHWYCKLSFDNYL